MNQIQSENSNQKTTCLDFDPQRINKYGFCSVSKDSHTSLEKNVELCRQREQKWFEMLRTWDHIMISDYNRVKARCRKGVPHSLRAPAWRALCGGAKLQHKNKGVFEELCSHQTTWVGCIEKDLHRTYKMHELFAEEGGLGQQEMKKVLHAYSVYNPKIGYCQGMGSIAGILLMIMPSEQAFWCLVSIMNKYLAGYYSDGLLAIQLDGRVMESIVHSINPDITDFLESRNVQATFYSVEWFMCVYTRTLPWETVLRVWDMFLCEGVKVLIKVGVTLIILAFKDKRVRDKCNSFDKAIKYLKYRLPKPLLEEDFFVTEMLRLKISEKMLKEEHITQLAKLKELCS